MIEVTVTVLAENAKGHKESTAILIATVQRMDTMEMEVRKRRVTSTCNPASSTPDQYQAFVFAFVKLDEMLAELGLDETDDLHVTFQSRIDNVSNRIFPQGDKLEKGKKWHEGLEQHNRNYVKFCASVAISTAMNYKAEGGSLKITNHTAFFDKKNNPATLEFKKIKGMNSSKTEFLFERLDVEERPMSLEGLLASDLALEVGAVDTSIVNACISAYQNRNNGGYGFRSA